MVAELLDAYLILLDRQVTLAYAPTMRRGLIGLLVAICITFGLAPVAQADDEMGTAKAGKYYLKSICPANKALERLQRVVFKGKNSISIAELKRRLPEARTEAARYGRAVYKFARAAFNPPAPWPSSVDQLVDKYATSEARRSTTLSQMGQADTASEWGRLSRRAARISNNTSGVSAQFRARLELPPPGKGC